jgi:general secretion pathway protein G
MDMTLTQRPVDRRRRRQKRQKGLTLVEILVVIVILGVLGAVVAVNVLPAADQARTQAASTQIDNISAALQAYYLDHSRYPTNEQGLEALIRPPRDLRTAERYRQGGYLATNEVPTDPWGNPYVYSYPGEFGQFDIISLGRDGQPGGEGPDADIVSWE